MYMHLYSLKPMVGGLTQMLNCIRDVQFVVHLSPKVPASQHYCRNSVFEAVAFITERQQYNIILLSIVNMNLLKKGSHEYQQIQVGIIYISLHLHIAVTAWSGLVKRPEKGPIKIRILLMSQNKLLLKKYYAFMQASRYTGVHTCVHWHMIIVQCKTKVYCYWQMYIRQPRQSEKLKKKAEICAHS